MAAKSKNYMKVDYSFDIPVELAAVLTGYRHDQENFEWGTLRFFPAERLDEEPSGRRRWAFWRR